jgi:hypothetical protein
MTQLLKIDADAFSAGQIESKIWAAEQLESIVNDLNISPLRMYVLGGWYSLLHFILSVRKNIDIEYCRSVDLDPIASYNANKINNAWEIKDWKFRAYPSDANKLEYTYDTDKINCVVNTSSEHFKSKLWYSLIPKGTLVLLQGNDLKISDHVSRPKSLNDFIKTYPLTDLKFSGTMNFQFKNMSYNRHMIIGIK